MPLNIIAGRAGSGKSSRLYEMINALGARGEEVMLLVPEQFTLQAERELIESSESRGYLSVNVSSSTRLAKSVFSSVLAPDRKEIDGRGKAALVSRIALSLKGELKVFAKAVSFSGFSSELSELISAMKKYDVTPEKLKNAAAAASTVNTDKIFDISKIYGAFDDFLKTRSYIDSDDKTNFMIETLPKADIYCDTHFFIDGYDRFTSQDLRMVQALLTLSGKLTVCVNADENSTDSIFDAGRMTIVRLSDIARKCGHTFHAEYAEKPHVNKHPSIEYLEKTLYSDNPAPYKKESAIKIIQSDDMLQEAEYAACNIINIIKDSGYTVGFRDISILCCGDLGEYGPLLKRIFDRYDIPCFTHKRKSMAQHPAVGYLLSAVSCKISGYSKSDVLTMLKSGYSGISTQDALLFEDYVLDNDIAYYLFERKLMRGAKKYDLDCINQIKDALILPTECLKSDKLPASMHLRNIYTMLEKANLKETLSRQQQRLTDNDLAEQAAQTAQAWNTIVEVLDQLHTIFGEEEMTLDEILLALEESFISTQIGILPVSSDEVLIGEMGRTKLSHTKYLMVLGANEGKLPAMTSENPILNNSDINILAENGIDMGAGSHEKRSYNDYLIYQALSLPSHGLYISYPLAGVSDVRLPSALCNQIQQIFDLEITVAEIDYTASKAAALSIAASAFGAIGDGRPADYIWDRAVSALINTKQAEGALDKMMMFASPFSAQGDIAPKRDGVIISSVSQLEQYAACPFSYMVKYALRPADDPSEEITPAGEGAFLHEAMERFGRKLKELDVNHMDTAQIEELMGSEAETIARNFDNQRLSRDGKGKYKAYDLIKTAKHGALIYSEHLKNSDFMPQEQELAFGEGRELGPIEITLESGTRVQISGKVDRLDTCDTQRYPLARIVDYKSSVKKIEYERLLSGRQIQLFIYMGAYLDKNPEVKASGVFYFPVRNQYLEEGKDRASVDMMRGAFIENDENLNALDRNFETLGSSRIIKAERKKDGDFMGNSDNVSEEVFKKLLDTSKNKAKALLSEIDSGQFPVYPVRSGNSSVCSYCDYASVCRKDINIHEENIESSSDEAKRIIFGGGADE